MKPDGIKVAMMIDVGNWAWAFKARAIQKYLNDEFRKISVVLNKEFHRGIMSKYHTTFFFGWMERKKLAGKYKGMVAGVSSHNPFLKHPEKAKKYLPRYNALAAVSMIIYNELKERKLNSNIYYTPNGVEEKIFTPGEKKEYLDKTVIGWLGQPSGPGFNRSGGLDMHGYHNILLPLIDSLKDNKEIHFKILGLTHKNAVPFDTMPDWYRSLDLYIGTQLGIGTPNSLFEANSCGVPGINTAIGAAPELIENGKNGYLLSRFNNKEEAKRRVEQFRELILKLHDDNKLLQTMGGNARDIIVEKWTWKERAKAYLPVFMNHRKKI